MNKERKEKKICFCQFACKLKKITNNIFPTKYISIIIFRNY